MTHRTVAPGLTSSRGVSLVEATLVLAVFALLAAVMAPTVNGYIDGARQARAREDVRSLGGAIQDFITDNGEVQFLIDANGTIGTPTGPPSRLDNNRVNLLVSDGDVPSLTATLATETYWRLPVNSTTVDTFSNHLIENRPQEATTSRYRTPSDIVVATPGAGTLTTDFARTSSASFNAPYAWRGTYLSSPIDSDPWGNRYAANVVFLDPAATVSITGITAGFTFSDYPRLDTFVLSAGADEEIDTPSAQDGASPGDDDIIYIVTSHAK
jgi:type II secretory pathway pseudopilin PulG